MEKNKSFENWLNEIGKLALAEARKRVAALGGTYTLPEGKTLYIDPCNDSGFLYNLDAAEVVLVEKNLIILSADALEHKDEILSGKYEPQPDECWTEGGEFYAEWEGLLELIDSIPSQDVPEVETKEVNLVKTVTDALNGGINTKKFAEALCLEHPTLQQSFFRLVRDCMAERAVNSNYAHDRRNEASMDMCRKYRDIIHSPLPFI